MSLYAAIFGLLFFSAQLILHFPFCGIALFYFFINVELLRHI